MGVEKCSSWLTCFFAAELATLVKMATFNNTEHDTTVQFSSNGAEPNHNYQGDANTLSPMENNHHVIKNNDNQNTKADLMTMSTPPHLLSAALGTSEDGQPSRRYYNHRNTASAIQKERE